MSSEFFRKYINILNESAPMVMKDNAKWYSDDDLYDIVGPDWIEEFETGGYTADQMVQEAQKWLNEHGFDVQVKGVREHDEETYEWLIQGDLTWSDESGVEEGEDDNARSLELYGLRKGDTVKAIINGKQVQGDIIDIFPDNMQVELLLRGPNAGKTVTVDVRDTESLNEQGVSNEKNRENFMLSMSKRMKGKQEPLTPPKGGYPQPVKKKLTKM